MVLNDSDEDNYEGENAIDKLVDNIYIYIYTLLKGRVQGLAHAHESKCCFSPVLVVASMQAILFHNIVKEPIRSE